MSRLRKRGTAPEGKDAGAQPNRDLSLAFEGLSQEGDGRRNGQERRSGRQRGWLLPQVEGKTLEGTEAQEGIDCWACPKQALLAVRIHCWSKALKAQNRPASDRFI